jgi:hypothetical protein
VADAPGAGHVLRHRVLEHLDLSDAAYGRKSPIPSPDGDARRVVAAVLEALQAFEKNGRSPPRPDIPDYSAHFFALADRSVFERIIAFDDKFEHRAPIQ